MLRTFDDRLAGNIEGGIKNHRYAGNAFERLDQMIKYRVNIGINGLDASGAVGMDDGRNTPGIFLPCATDKKHERAG